MGRIGNVGMNGEIGSQPRINRCGGGKKWSNEG